MTTIDRAIESALTWPLRWLARKAIGFTTENVDWYARNGYPQLYSAFGGSEPSYSGKSVTHETALTNSVVWVCTRILSEALAMLPLMLYRRDGEAKFRADTHSLYRILHDAPNDEMSSVEFRETMMVHAVTRGNAYSRIVRQPSGRVVALMPPFHPGSVQVGRNKRGAIQYKVALADGKEQVYPASEIFHIRGLGFDGLVGYSVITQAKNSIGNAMSADQYAGEFYANGGRVPYILKHPGNFRDDDDAKEFRKNWDASYGSSNTFHRAPILPGGLEYQQIGMSAEDAQFLETRQFNVPEICRWFRIPPHMASDLSKATFSNIEEQSLEFVIYTLTPWLRKWESTIWRSLLGRTEQGRYFAEFNLSALLRGNAKDRGEYYSKLIQAGMMKPNEGRSKENMNPAEGGDKLYIQGAMVPIDKAGQGGKGNGIQGAKT